MIQGTVVGLQARLNLILIPSRRIPIEIECVVDTGFEEFLTLPPAMVTALELTYLAPLRAILADNSRTATNVYQATIDWNGVDRDIAVLAMSRRSLISTALLEDYHLGIDFCETEIVLIDDILRVTSLKYKSA